jgi:dephospho-CoA kinase
MKIIGLLGGVASGKSAVAAALARRGAVIFDADRIGHAVLDDPEVRDLLVAQWGSEALGDDGALSRAAIARKVFADTPQAAAARRFLEQTVHPRIRQHIERGIAALPPETPAAIIDAPLLIEAGWADSYHLAVFVDCPREQRLARALTRGWTPEAFARREAAQLPIEEKRRASNYVIDNSGALDDLEAEVSRFWREIFPEPAQKTS